MNRKCGGCTLCCKLLPVTELEKSAGQRCRYQSSKGCAVHHQPPAFPRSCGVWACRWLNDPDTESMRRPDRVGYVIDQMPDLVRVINNDTGEEQEIIVLQVWCDPARRDAWQDPGLLRYAEKLAAENQMAMLVRYDSREATFVSPPPLSADGKWHSVTHGTIAPSETGSLLLDKLHTERSRDVPPT